MEKKALNSWAIAGVVGFLYSGFYWVLLNIINPAGNDWTFLEFVWSTGTAAISMGCIFLCYAFVNRFFRRMSLGYRYIFMLLLSIPLFCLIYLPYWVSFLRHDIYHVPTDPKLYGSQLLTLTTGQHLPIAIIAIASLYNAQAHKAQLHLLNVQNVLAETQLKNLQQQVDPHFLFNSLNILSALIKLDADKSVLFTQKLSDVYRFFLRTQKDVLISLEEELQFVNDYFFLIECRFGFAFQLAVQHDSAISCDELYLIPGTLQLLVENVVKHNTANEASPIVIEITISNQLLIITNRLQKKENVSTGYGLINLVLRYQLLNKKLGYFERDGMFRVEVPLLKNIA